LQLVASSTGALNTEGEAPVRRGIGHGGHEQRDEVRRLRAQRASNQEQHQVGQGAEHPNRAEPQRLPRE
jgi:hypothetical protein